MAKISVLIPTYNRPAFLKQALESIANQTKLPYEIIVGDDNLENDINYQVVKEFREKYPYIEIKYIKNEKRLGGAGNYKSLFYKAEGDYIKWLADDDILLPDALEALSYFLDKYPNVKVVTSTRIAVDKDLDPLLSQPLATKHLFKYTKILPGRVIGKKSLKDLTNYVGEFSTYMFRKKDVNFDLFKLDNMEFKINADWFTWLLLAKDGDIAYIPQSLSLFRITESNEQLSFDARIIGLKELFYFVNSEFFNEHFPLNKRQKLKQLSSFLFNLGSLPKDVYNSVNSLRNKVVSDIRDYVKSDNREPVSIITVTYNSEKTLDTFLSSVLDSMGENDELIIVDNNSQDKTRKILENLNVKNVKVILNKENVGYSKGINIGIKASKNPYLIFLNPDTIVYENWIDLLINHFNSENVGGVGPLSTYVIPKQNIFEYYPEFKYVDINDFYIMSNIVKSLGYKRSINTKLLVGFCFATKREILEKVGYLDEDLFLGNDDLELSWRLREHGYKLKIALDTFIYHEGHVSFKTESKNKTEKLVQESTNRLADKLIEYYGYGKVPHPMELWDIGWFIPSGEKYRYMFSIKGKEPKKNIESLKEKITVVLVNYKSSKDTAESVKSLLEQEYDHISIIVVDNSEEEVYVKELLREIGKTGIFPYVLTEDEADLIRLEFKKDVLIVKANENKGFSAGNNIGIRIAQKNNSDYIWILNPDTYVPRDSLYELLKTSKMYDAEVVTCKIKNFFDKDLVQYDGSSYDYKGEAEKPDIIKIPLFLSGSNLLIKTEVFDKVGYWDEDFFIYLEDNEFFHRLKEKNILKIYTPFTYIYHKGATSTNGYLKDPLYVYYLIRNVFILRDKIGDKSYPLKKLLRDIYSYYDFLFRHKNLLRALVVGVYEYLLGKKGKSDISHDKLKKYEFKDSSLTDDVNNVFRMAFLYPRKEEYFLKLLTKTYLLLNNEKNYRRVDEWKGKFLCV